MSRLFGPLSETISKVSCRLCAFAGENTAGAAMPAAAAETDLRKSRRFMCRAPARMVSEGDSARDVPDPRDALTQQLRYCYCWVLRPVGILFREAPHSRSCIQWRSIGSNYRQIARVRSEEIELTVLLLGPQRAGANLEQFALDVLQERRGGEWLHASAPFALLRAGEDQ